MSHSLWIRRRVMQRLCEGKAMSWRRECNYVNQVFALAKIHSWEMAKEKPFFGRGYCHTITHIIQVEEHIGWQGAWNQSGMLWNMMLQSSSRYMCMWLHSILVAQACVTWSGEGLGFLQTYLSTLLGVSMWSP